MTIRMLLNAFLGDYKELIVMEYSGPVTIGADLEEDYTEIFRIDYRRLVPADIQDKNVEYFGTQDGNLIIYLEKE